jgi:F-type H+-transporting ATPase subunit delta
MFAKVIADRYARAVLHSCPDLATIDRARIDLVLISDTYRKSEPTREFLFDPKMPTSIKISIIRRGLEDRLSPVVLHLLMLLLDKHRQSILPDIADRFSELVDKVRGVDVAEVITAVDIPRDLRERLEESVQRFSARTVEVQMKVDPSILGGVIVRLGDKVVDGSLKSRFRDLRRSMLATRLPRMRTEEE